jgi:hypothetical protein
VSLCDRLLDSVRDSASPCARDLCGAAARTVARAGVYIHERTRPHGEMPGAGRALDVRDADSARQVTQHRARPCALANQTPPVRLSALRSQPSATTVDGSLCLRSFVSSPGEFPTNAEGGHRAISVGPRGPCLPSWVSEVAARTPTGIAVASAATGHV